MRKSGETIIILNFLFFQYPRSGVCVARKAAENIWTEQKSGCSTCGQSLPQDFVWTYSCDLCISVQVHMNNNWPGIAGAWKFLDSKPNIESWFGKLRQGTDRSAMCEAVIIDQWHKIAGKVNKRCAMLNKFIFFPNQLLFPSLPHSLPLPSSPTLSIHLCYPSLMKFPLWKSCRLFQIRESKDLSKSVDWVKVRIVRQRLLVNEISIKLYH